MVLNLFKYYSPKYEGEFNLSFYSRRAIYFQQPIKFNDPWDCKAPPLKLHRQINNLKNIYDKLAKRNGQYFVKKEWQRISKSPRSEIKNLFEGCFKEAFEKKRSEIGVFSLSFIPDSELMWSHYTNSHFGYMLHFQIDPATYLIDSSLSKVGIPIPVIYKDKREVWNLEKYHENREKYVYDLVRYKSSAWEYECELRLLNVTKYGFIKTPSDWLKSIVIGLNTEDGLRSKLEDIGNELNIPVFSALMDNKDYKITIPGLGVDGNQGRMVYKELIDSKIFELSSAGTIVENS
ncbi:MAG: DUF2971 domain-containing protein [Thermodesulfobacteriota bacterium]